MAHYIEQSLTGNEQVLIFGRFHWIYYVGGLLWILFGFLICMGIMAASVGWTVMNEVHATYPDLPKHLFGQAWSHVVDRHGGYIALIRDIHPMVRIGAFVIMLIGILLFAHMMIVRATTEIAVTTQRLVLKEGIVARAVDEMSINRIESVHVMQSVLGRMLDYGTVMVRGMGIGEIILPPLAHPVEFRNALDKAKQSSETEKP